MYRIFLRTHLLISFTFEGYFLVVPHSFVDVYLSMKIIYRIDIKMIKKK